LLLFSASAQYGGMIYIGLPLLFDLVWYYCLVILFPWLRMPHIRYDLIFGTEESYLQGDSDVIIFSDEYGNKIIS